MPNQVSKLKELLAWAMEGWDWSNEDNVPAHMIDAVNEAIDKITVSEELDNDEE